MSPGFSAISSVATDDPAIASAITWADANVNLRYFFAIESTGAAPFSIDTVPLTFNMTGSVERQGDTNTLGFLGVMNSSFIFDGISIDSSTSSLSFERSDSYLSDIPYSVSLLFYCTSVVSGPGASSCAAVATATLAFDQALFDQLYGDDSFLLSDYFSIQLSPGLVAVPLPGAVGLLALALSVLLPRARRSAA